MTMENNNQEQQEQLTWWQSGLIVTLSIALSIVFTLLFGVDTTSIDLFSPPDKKSDFQITDIYNAVEINQAEDTVYSMDVVVVSTDGLDRKQIIDIINLLEQMQPTAIGIDIPFMDSTDNREYLLKTIFGNRNIVCATTYDTTPNNIYYQRKPRSFFEEEFPTTKVGFVKLDATNPWSIVRTFHPYVLLGENDTLPNMALALAQIADPRRAHNLLARKNQEEIIDFSSCTIRTIPANTLNDSAIIHIQDKIVLLGDVNYAKDLYMTPRHEPLPGVMIHAYATHTIMSGSYIKEYPKWSIWLIAIFISLIFTIPLQLAKKYMSNVGNMFIRIVQFLTLFLLVWIGCWKFSTEHIYINFSPAIFMLGFSALTFDIANGIYGIHLFAQKHCNKNKKQ